MNKKVLIPIDFTDYAERAITYACELNKITKHDIDLAHIFTSHSNIYQNSLRDPSLIDPLVAFAKRDAQHIIEKFSKKYPDIKFNIIFKDGNLFDQIESIVKKSSYDAIIMGTEGSYGIESLLLGSNTYEVFQNTKTPVLAIPHNFDAYKVEKIGLLCNFKSAEIEVLKQATYILGTHAELILIHINKGKQDLKEIDKNFSKFIDKIILETGIENISYTIKAQTFFVKKKENICSAINSVIKDEQLDLLLVTKSKKGFLQKILEENVVKQMAYDVNIPKFFGKS